MTEKIKKDEKDEIMDLQDAGDYARVSWRAMYFAIRRGHLVGHKGIDNKWYVTRQAVDEYRMNKYNPDKKCHDGKKVYDIENGYLSVQHVARTLGVMLNRPYDVQHIYYLIRKGELTCYKKGYSVVIKKEDAIALYESELKTRQFGNMEMLKYAS